MGPQCHREIDSNVIIGCEWSEWTPWSRCTKTCGGGTEQRVREKLPGLGSCADGNSTDSRLCQVRVAIQWDSTISGKLVPQLTIKFGVDVFNKDPFEKGLY